MGVRAQQAHGCCCHQLGCCPRLRHVAALYPTPRDTMRSLASTKLKPNTKMPNTYTRLLYYFPQEDWPDGSLVHGPRPPRRLTATRPLECAYHFSCILCEVFFTERPCQSAKSGTTCRAACLVPPSAQLASSDMTLPISDTMSHPDAVRGR